MPSPVIKPFLIPKSRASFKRDEYLESLTQKLSRRSRTVTVTIQKRDLHVTQKKHRELILNLFVQIFIEKCYSIITSFNFD